MGDIGVQKQSLSITVDLEDWYHIPSVCGSPFSVYPSVGDFYKKWSHRYDYLSEPTSMVLDLLDEFRIKATFFIVADLVNHYPGLVESVARRGHEIACHGLEHSCKIHPETREPLISHREFEERTAQAKEMLEAACGEEVIGYRAPNVLVAVLISSDVISQASSSDAASSIKAQSIIFKGISRILISSSLAGLKGLKG
jgi:hypothetical protein